MFSKSVAQRLLCAASAARGVGREATSNRATGARATHVCLPSPGAQSRDWVSGSPFAGTLKSKYTWEWIALMNTETRQRPLTPFSNPTCQKP
jgi:hypothetical protein